MPARRSAPAPVPDDLLASLLRGLVTGVEERARQAGWIALRAGEAVPREGIARLVEAALLHGAVR